MCLRKTYFQMTHPMMLELASCLVSQRTWKKGRTRRTKVEMYLLLPRACRLTSYVPGDSRPPSRAEVKGEITMMTEDKIISQANDAASALRRVSDNSPNFARYIKQIIYGLEVVSRPKLFSFIKGTGIPLFPFCPQKLRSNFKAR